MTQSSPDLVEQKIGVNSPLSDYVKFLPKDVPLPTFYSRDTRELLSGTSLADALEQKLASLEQEFEHLKKSTQHIEWCKRVWWDDFTGKLSFEDWKLADAMYRSRAIELPRGVGDSMVPLVDMANHASDNRYNARFDIDNYGQVVLLVRDGLRIKSGDEITIMYGVGGACEMIFSYGFVEEDAQSAREIFLSFPMPQDDPLRLAKIYFAKEAPGIRIYTGKSGRVHWDSDFIWWACVNEEDGLDFQVLQSTDGGKELQAFWKEELLDELLLKDALQNDPKSEIFRLRAVVMILERVERQGEEMGASQGLMDQCYSQGSTNHNPITETIRKLRGLEMELLAASYQSLEAEVRSHHVNEEQITDQ